jgi:hypothetical protein
MIAKVDRVTNNIEHPVAVSLVHQATWSVKLKRDHSLDGIIATFTDLTVEEPAVVAYCGLLK